MNAEDTDYVHLPVSSSVGHGSSSSNRSETPRLSDMKHVRMGRGLVRVKKYENEALRAKRSPTSPTAPDPLPSPTEETKRKWFQPRLRNISLGGRPPVTPETPSPDRRGEIRSWLDAQTQEGWDSSSRSGSTDRSATLEIHREESDGESVLTYSTSSRSTRPELSINSGPNLAGSTSIHENDATPTASHTTISPLRNLVPQTPEEEDEDAHFLLQALGLGETQHPENEYHIEPNNLSDPEEHTTPTAPARARRPLPAIPDITPRSPPFSPGPNDSQDADAYVFGTGPRITMRNRQSHIPPPPYASRYSIVADRPAISIEELALLQQRLRSTNGQSVAPLVIRPRRGGQPVQWPVVVENS